MGKGFTPSNMERGVRPSNTGREVGSCCAQLWRSGLKLEMRSWSWLLLLLLPDPDPELDPAAAAWSAPELVPGPWRALLAGFGSLSDILQDI